MECQSVYVPFLGLLNPLCLPLTPPPHATSPSGRTPPPCSLIDKHLTNYSFFSFNLKRFIRSLSEDAAPAAPIEGIVKESQSSPGLLQSDSWAILCGEVWSSKLSNRLLEPDLKPIGKIALKYVSHNYERQGSASKADHRWK
jgi:hypothetical protein